jgi:YlmC/YmxH family sporulation protein
VGGGLGDGGGGEQQGEQSCDGEQFSFQGWTLRYRIEFPVIEVNECDNWEGNGMEDRWTQLRYKEVINVEDGSRYGYVGDMEIDWTEGKVRSLVVPGRLRLLGLLGREEDVVIPFSAVRRLGEDIILVDGAGGAVRRLPGKRSGAGGGRRG